MSKSIQQLTNKYLETRKDTDFTNLYNKLYPGIKNYISKMFASERDVFVEDVVSVTFQKIYEKIHTYNPVYSLSTWAYRIARNEALTVLRKDKHEISLSSYTEDEDSLDPMSLEGVLDKEALKYSFDMEIQETALATKMYCDEVRKKIRLLKPLYRDIIIDTDENNFSYKDVALKYELPINTVKSRIHTGRINVRKMMKGISIDDF